MEKTKLNTELLKAIREKIATVPQAYDQGTYARASDVAPCGTAACIAGWACVLSGAMSTDGLRKAEEEGEQEMIHETAQTALGLNNGDAERLFDGNPSDEYEGYGWPEPFKGQWLNWPPSDRPQIAVAYLTRIIETGEVLN